MLESESDAIEYQGSYRGLMASSWNFIRGDSSNWTDTAFYREIIRDNGEPALDVGCGTGRILLQFLEDGMDVEGLDNAPEMLDICERDAAGRGLRPTLHCQSIESVSIDRRFRTIFVASTSLCYVPTREHVSTTLRRFFDHLEPGGKVVLSAGIAPSDLNPEPEQWQLDFEQIRPNDGATVQWWGKVGYDQRADVIRDKSRLHVVVDDRVVETEYFEESRLALTTEEYEVGLERAGFIDITMGDKPIIAWLGTRP